MSSVKKDGDIAKREKRPLHRSPAYPAIDLADAIEKAKKLYNIEKRHSVSPTIVAEHWGFSIKTGSFRLALSALKKYGLLEDEPEGDKVKLTNVALSIILDDRPDSTERQRLIKEAALRPTIHAELWEKYGSEGLPSDSTIKHFLIVERQFNDAYVDKVIRVFKETISYAGLNQTDRTNSEENFENFKPLQSDPQKNHIGNVNVLGRELVGATGGLSKNIQDFTFPLMDGVAIIRIPRPMSEVSFNMLIGFLNNAKSALVSHDNKE